MTRVWVIAQTAWREAIRKKDVYVLLILMGVMLISLSALNIFGLGGMARYVLDVGLILAWAFSWLLAMVTSSGMLPREEANGTLLPLLAKPVSRFELVFGKWLGAWAVAMASTGLFYLLIVGVAALRGSSTACLPVLQGYVLHGFALGVMTAIGILCSTRMNHDAAATLGFVVTGAALLVVPHVPELLTRETGLTAALLMVMYNLLPHFEVFDMRLRIVHDYGPADWGVFGLVCLYGLILAVVFVLLAWLAYRNKKFSRSERL